MRVGIIGAGFFGEKHAQALGEVPGFSVVAASRTGEAAAQEFADQYGGAPYTRYEDVLADPNVEAVLIATPHATHEEIAVAAAAAGKHTLLEKPMAHDLAACKAVATAFRGGPALLIGHVSRFSRAFRMAKEMIEAGEIGEVVSAHASMRKRWFEPNRRQWHQDRSLGGGVLLTGGVHALDRLMWLVDQPVSAVSAVVQTRFHDQPADDFGVLFLRFAEGASGVVNSIGYATGAPNHDTEIIGTEGILRVHSVTGVSVGKGETWRDVPNSGDPNWLQPALQMQWRELASAAHRGEATPIDAVEGLRVMNVLFRAEESARAGAELPLEAV